MLGWLAFLWGVGFPLWRVFDAPLPEAWWHPVLVVLAMAGGGVVVAVVLPYMTGMLTSGCVLGAAVGAVAAPIRGDWILEPALLAGAFVSWMVSMWAHGILRHRETRAVL